jgi:uncharacterized protein
MVRLLFWIALIAAAYWFWRKFKSPEAPRRDNSLDSPLKMVRCAQCGVHLPKDRALPRGGNWYCSQAHLEKGPDERQR